MSSAVPVPPPPAERVAKSSQSRQRRGFWYKLRRRHDLRRIVSTATLWLVTVIAVWIVLKQIIK
jgi:hypothetical protein